MSVEFVFSYRPGRVENLQHALLPVDLHLLSVAVFDRRVVFFNENPLYELHSQRRLANTSASEHDDFVLAHF